MDLNICWLLTCAIFYQSLSSQLLHLQGSHIAWQHNRFEADYYFHTSTLRLDIMTNAKKEPVVTGVETPS